jgi:mono/diheme cytochrome c family protein
MKYRIASIAAIVSATSLFASAPAMAADLTGAEVFNRHCVHCHGDSLEATGTLQLARTRGKDQALLTERKDLAPLYVTHVVRHGLKAMPAFVPSDLNDAQLKALTDYLAK